MNHINAQEIFLLEKYTSVDYFVDLCETWSEMVSHVETILARFMRNLPPDYRSRLQAEQPDIVWGGRVLPNFRSTLQALRDGCIRLSQGELNALVATDATLIDFKGQADFWSGWMGKEDEARYSYLLSTAVLLATNISTTEAARWKPRQLTWKYDVAARGSLPDQIRWPRYALSSKIKVKSGDRLPVSGIYLPDVADSCAEFLSTRYKTAPRSYVFIEDKPLLAPDTGLKYGEKAIYQETECTWTLIERADGTTEASSDNGVLNRRYRVLGGSNCPETGYYLTPAIENSRKRFTKGALMPTIASSYGITIWQWDTNQD